MKTVAIIGAGPAGLVTAKTLLRHEKGTFTVTIFEKQDRVGGMWALQPEELHGGKCNPGMPTNLSRFSVSFSDLAWQSVELKDRASDAVLPLPIYPKAWQVGRYLQEYSRRYVPDECLKLRCQVKSATKVETNNKTQWRVQWLKARPDPVHHTDEGAPSDHMEEDLFDYLIVGTGFFGAPRQPSFAVQGEDGPTVLHSSSFRAMEDLIPESSPEMGNVVVVGGGMSGSEAAVAVAMAQSNALHAPGTSSRSSAHKIIHVVARPFYDIPRMHPQASSELPQGHDDRAPRFLPNDLSMFNLSKVPPGSNTPKNGLVPAGKAEEGHLWMHSIIGGDQSDTGSAGLQFSEAHQRRPGFIGITDSYTAFARSGAITTLLGRVNRVDRGVDRKMAVLQYTDENGREHSVEDVIGVIYATGFTPHSSLSLLDEAVLRDLEYDERSQRLPVILSHHTTYHPSHPDMGFVGMYEGAFWAVMEAQAREITRRWSSSDTETAIPLEYEEPDMHELRTAILENRTDVPQFWMRDYLNMVESLARRHEVKRTDVGFGERAGPIAAARYTSSNDDQSQAQSTIADLQSVLRDHAESGRFVSAAIFRGLQGRWRITRKLDSFLPGFPSGTLNGYAYFHPRSPTHHLHDAEYLFIETGTLTTESGLTLNANKRYAYRYSEPRDQITVWFVKEDTKTIDYLFHPVVLTPRSTKSSAEGWRASGSHWCDPDQYECDYRFSFRGATLLDFTIKFVVKGPNKDYISETHFERATIG